MKCGRNHPQRQYSTEGLNWIRLKTVPTHCNTQDKKVFFTQSRVKPRVGVVEVFPM